MQKVVKTEAKAGLRSNIMVQNSGICCFKSHYFSNNIVSKVQTQGATVKDPRLKEPKVKDPKIVLQLTNITESSEQGRKNQKRRTKKCKQD